MMPSRFAVQSELADVGEIQAMQQALDGHKFKVETLQQPECQSQVCVHQALAAFLLSFQNFRFALDHTFDGNQTVFKLEKDPCQ